MTTEQNIDRRNYALVGRTFDTEHLLQISCDDEVLVTICESSDPLYSGYFFVFNGTGLDDNENDLPIGDAVKWFKGDSHDAWRQAVRFGYSHALAKMMTHDAREEREAYGTMD